MVINGNQKYQVEDWEEMVEPGVQPVAPNPELVIQEVEVGARPGDTYVRIRQPHARFFRRVGPGHFVATTEANRADSSFERAYRRLKSVLIGHPLETAQEIHQRLDKIKALAVFGSDAISSCAYATEETLIVLMAAGSGALYISQFTALAIALLLSMVAFSYRQTVYAYPHGGGSYNVSRENLGQLAGLVAASALLIDYVLTVSVSIVAGAAAVSSAMIASGFGAQVDAINATLPPNLNVNVLLSVFFILVMTVGNLRGIRESGTIFAIPTYLFLGSLALLLAIGLFKALTGTLEPASTPPAVQGTETLGLWLILRAFSAGAVAMSGTEAISNGVPAFQKPESKNAATTLTIMATILGVAFLGISYLAVHMHLVPGDETIISQIARAVFGTNILYYVFQIGTMGILVIAANTAFADFPRLSSILGRDDYMPHQFRLRGDRLAFSTGIISLSLIAAVLLLVFNGDTHLLIPLYAVGVFLAFTLSQAGMVMHWYRLRHPGWRRHAVVNGIGAALTAVVLIIAAVTKFEHGAWIIILAIPVIVAVFYRINRHYTQVRVALELTSPQQVPRTLNMLVLVVIPSVNYATERALSFARTISHNVAAVHVAFDQTAANLMRERLHEFDPDVNLVTLEDPYRRFYAPLASYVEAIQERDPNMFVTIVLPEFVVRHWWERFLHNRATKQLGDLFRSYPNVAIVNVPYRIERVPGKEEPTYGRA